MYNCLKAIRTLLKPNFKLASPNNIPTKTAKLLVFKYVKSLINLVILGIPKVLSNLELKSTIAVQLVLG